MISPALTHTWDWNLLIYSQAADRPMEGSGGLVDLLLAGLHFYAHSHGRHQHGALFWEHQFLGNLPLEQFEVEHLVGCAIIKDTPEEGKWCKGERARFLQTRSGLTFEPEPFSSWTLSWASFIFMHPVMRMLICHCIEIREKFCKYDISHLKLTSNVNVFLSSVQDHFFSLPT